MNKIIQQKLTNYFSTKPVQKAYIFGSFARNQQTRKSDIDILVDIEPSYLMSLIEFGGMLEDLKELLNRKVDLVSSDGISKHLKPVIEQEKILIYER